MRAKVAVVEGKGGSGGAHRWQWWRAKVAAVADEGGGGKRRKCHVISSRLHRPGGGPVRPRSTSQFLPPTARPRHLSGPKKGSF